MLTGASLSRLNLASRPFENRRPLTRVVAALWLLVAVFTALNATMFLRHRSTATEEQTQLGTVRTGIDEEVATLDRLQRELRGFDLDGQNPQVDFLNQKIRQRAFPWSRLFEQLAEVLPAGVRLKSLTPSLGRAGDDSERRKKSGEAEQRWVDLQISAEAQSDDAILRLVDALFANPSFRSPNLRQEAQNRGGLYSFALEVKYLPEQESPRQEGTAPVTSQAHQQTPAPDDGAPAGATESAR